MALPPEQARVVIVGGGVIGCSVAYHLTQLGWRDVVLLERKQLTSGTTWHAAGLIAQLRATKNMTRLAKYSQELYGRLEAETGVATGFRRNGSITVALSEARREEILRQASMARASASRSRRSAPPSSRPATRMSMSRTSRRRFISTRTAKAIRPTSRWRWPRARRCAARRSSSAPR